MDRVRGGHDRRRLGDTLTAREALAALLLAATGAIWLAVERGWTAALDTALLRAMAGGPAAAWQLLTVAGDSGVRIAVALAAILRLVLARRPGDGAWLTLAVGGGIGLNALAKAIFDRPRPDLLPHLDDVGVLSFPSGHSAGAMVLGLALALVAGRRWGIALALVYALVIGLSRMALAVHWPSDVAAGWCLGAAWVLGLSAADRRWRPARHTRSGSRP